MPDQPNNQSIPSEETPGSLNASNPAASGESTTATEYLDLNNPQAEATSTADLARIEKSARRKGQLVRAGIGLTILFIFGLLGSGVFWLKQRYTSKPNLTDNIPITNSVGLDAPTNKGNKLNPSQLSVNGDVQINGLLQLSPQAITDLAKSLNTKVDLQSNFPGTAQAGSIRVIGTIGATSFQGDGGLLNNLNASLLSSGTVNDARLGANITRLGQVIPVAAFEVPVVSSINSVINNGGNIQLVGGSGVTITADNTNKTVTIDAASGSGDITGVIAGSGLTGGGLSGDVTLNVDSTVTLQGNSFNGANQLVQLNGSGALPALSATNLTNLNASNVSSGTLNDARLSSNVTVQGNTFNVANQLLQLDGSGALPALSGINLTNLNANNISSGTLNDSRLSTNVTTQGNTFNLPSKLVLLNVSGELPALSGTNLTNLNASSLTSGSVNDARLSANVALLNANQTFSGNNTFSGTLTANTIQPSASMVIGAVGQSLTLQGNLSTKLTANNAGNVVAVGFTGVPTGNVTYAFDAATTPGSYGICTTVGNCASAGGGVTTLGGTTNKLTKFTGAQSIGDSTITDSGSAVTVAATGLFQAGSNSTTAFQIQDTAGTSNLFVADTTNSRIAIGQATANYPLDVVGDINSSTGLRVGGNLVCNSTGCSATASSGFYIQNGVSLQTAANFNIESAATGNVVGIFKAKSGQTADILQAKNGAGSVVAFIDKDGNINTAGQYLVAGAQIASSNLSNDANLAKLNGNQTFTGNNIMTGTVLQQNASNSTSAFRIQNAAGTTDVLRSDTSNNRVGIGYGVAAPPGYTLDVNGDINIASGSAYRINGIAICGPSATCAPDAGSSNYIQNGTSLQAATNYYIQSASASSVGGVIRGAVAQSANLFEARDGSNNTVLSISPSAVLTLGNQTVYDGNIVFNNATNAFTHSLQIATPSANRSLILPNESGTVCVQNSVNCGFALTSGSGNYIQNGTSTQTANYNIQSAAAGSVVGILQGASSQTADLFQLQTSTPATVLSVSASGAVLSKNSANSTTAFQIQNAAGTSNLFVADSTNTRIGIGKTSPSYTLDVNGDTNIASGSFYRINGVAICGASATCAPASGSANYIQNGTSTQTANFNIQSAASGSIGAVIQGASSQSADLLQLKTSTPATVLSVSASGAVLSKNSANSTTAFQIQNAAGNNLLAVDSTNSKLTFNSTTNAETTSWTTNSNNLNAATSSIGSTIYNGFLYSTTNGSTTFTYARVNSDGSVGAASTTTALPATASSSAVVAHNGYLYVVYGAGSNGFAYARINSDGTVGSWALNVAGAGGNVQTASNMVVVNNGIMYIFGQSGTTAYYGRINANGSVSSWTGFSIPAIRYNSGVVVANGYIFMIGGTTNGTSALQTSIKARLNADGSVGSFSSTTANFGTGACGTASLGVMTHNTYVLNGFVYVAGGTPDTAANATSSVCYGRVSSTGDISSWALASNSLPAARLLAAGTSANGYMYFLGGMNTASANQNSIYYTSGARMQLIGSLDLIGPGGGNLSDSAGTAGGSIFAGKIYSNSDLEIAGNSQLNNGLSVSGTANFKPNANSTSSFQIQNASGVDLFNVDSTNTQLTFNGGFSGDIKAWTTNANSLPAALASPATAIVNGYIYAISGITQPAGYAFIAQSMTGACAIRYAKLNADGSIGSWTTSSVTVNCTNSTFFTSSAVALNGRIYVGITSTGSIDSFKPNTDGSITAGSVESYAYNTNCTTNYPKGAQNFFTANGYLYANGTSDANYTYLMRMTVNGSTGSISGCTAITPTAGRSYALGAASVVANGYLFTIGGDANFCANTSSQVRYARLNADGSLGTEASTTSLPQAMTYVGAVYSNGYIYVMGGASNYCATTNYSSVYYARVNSDGTLGAWATSANNLPVTRSLFQAQVYNGYIYSIGGVNTTTGGQSAIYYTSTARLQVNASLDLVGDLGTNAVSDLATGQGGGSITAGKITAVSGLEVYGSTQVNGNVNIRGNGTNMPLNVQNAAGLNLLNADSAKTQVTVNNTSGTELSNWLATNNTGLATILNGAVALNGYMYSFGGAWITPYTNVQYAKINGDGTTGTFAGTTASLTAAGIGDTTGGATYNGYIYVARTGLNTIQYARPTATGDITAWTTSSTTMGSTTLNASNAVVIANGYLYVVGTGANYRDVYYAKINADGSLGTFTTASAPWGANNLQYLSAVVSNGYLVVMGGMNGSAAAVATVYTFKLNSNGSLGTLNTTTSLPAVRCAGTGFVMNGNVYYAGGRTGGSCNGGDTATIYSTRLNANGTITAWATGVNALGTTYAYGPSVVNNGYVYFPQGLKAGQSQSVNYMTGARLQVFGNLDLVNMTNAGVSDNNDAAGGSGGGSIAAGKVTATGGLEVYGNSQLNGGLAIAGNLQLTGITNIRPDADSTTAFVIQNAAGSASALSVDSTNLKVTVKDLLVTGHIISGGTAPTIAANAGAGTGPTISIAGTDTAGTVTLTTGTSPTVSADVFTVTFATAFASAPQVVFSPTNGNAAALTGNGSLFATPATSTFKLTVGSAGLTASTQYKWTYLIIQ